MELHWRTSVGVSVFHAADQMRRGWTLGAADLVEALREPTAKLVQGIEEERLSPELFWRHLVPLSAELDNPRQLAEVVLVKLQGRLEAQIRIPRFQRALSGLRAAYFRVMPDFAESLPRHVEALRLRWLQESPGLLAGVQSWTDEGILVEQATVFVLPPVTPGGGWAHLAQNTVRIEAADDTPAELPEILRLAWLLAQLNLDVPAYCENIPPQRLDNVAALAMIPAVLAAEANLKRSTCTDEHIAQAVRQWLPPSDRRDAHIGTLTQWWETYKARRPPWSAALEALDRLLAD